MTTPGSGPGGDLHALRADLTQAAGILDSVAGSLSGRAPDLRRQPDAGASSDEVASALAALAGAVSGVATEVRATAEATRTSAADFTATDQSVGDTMRQRRGGLIR